MQHVDCLIGFAGEVDWWMEENHTLWDGYGRSRKGAAPRSRTDVFLFFLAN